MTSSSTFALSATTTGTNAVLSVTNAGTGNIMTLVNGAATGAQVGLALSMSSTSTQAFAFKIIGAATNSGIFQTSGVATGIPSGSVAAALRIVSGSTTYYIPALSTFA